mmetsp:Transcript_22338/g.49847  ORF Transcript_22338/g.49847 Transcript_22338/m.49847 type:complete len:294 (-) Transcript_22338:28-909(-)
MIDANVPRKYRYRCFVLATSAAMMLDWLVTVDIAGVEKSRFEHCFGCLPKFAANLRTEAGVVTIKSDNWPAVKNQAVTCFFAGYLNDSSHDAYQMYEPINNTIYRTRDIMWLDRMYFPKAKMPPVDILDNFTDILDSDDEAVDAVEVEHLITNFEGVAPFGRITNSIPNEVEIDSESESDSEPEAESEEDNSPDEIDPEEIDDPVEPVDSDEERQAVENLTVEEPAEELYRTRYGWAVKPVQHLLSALNFEAKYTPAEEKFHSSMRELNEYGLLNTNAPCAEAMVEEASLVGL